MGRDVLYCCVSYRGERLRGERERERLGDLGDEHGHAACVRRVTASAQRGRKINRRGTDEKNEEIAVRGELDAQEDRLVAQITLNKTRVQDIS